MTARPHKPYIVIRSRWSHISGPTIKAFKTQDEALNYANELGCDLGVHVALLIRLGTPSANEEMS